MSLLDSLSSGLSYAGDVESKFGGRAIRGALAGKPRELASVIPFSDTLGITDPKQATSGSELATKLGVNHPLGNAAAGFGLEVATDPLNYMGGLGLAKAASGVPKAAEAASSFGALRRLREATPFVKNLGGASERVVGSHGFGGMEQYLPQFAKMAKSEAERGMPGSQFLGSSWAPWMKKGLPGFGYSTEAGGTPTAMHELYGHLVPELAAQTGQFDALRNQPLGYAAAKLHQAGLAGGQQEKGFAHGMGTILSELHARGIENRKAPGGYWGDVGSFLFNPKAHQLYDPTFRYRSPAAANLFHAAPGTIVGGAAGAAGGAGVGYEENGVPGGFAGAALGGLGGAALGGGLSAWRLTPKAVRAVGQSPSLGASAHDLAAKQAWDQLAPLLRSGEKLKWAEKQAANNAFVDAADAMNLHPEVEKRLYDARHRMETFGNPWASADEQTGAHLRNALDNAGESFFGEDPAMRAIPPNPVDLGARKALEGANWEMASGAPERFSTDPARKAYYTLDRQLRDSRRRGYLDRLNLPPESLAARLRSGLKGEMPSLNLKYDQLKLPDEAGLTRESPEWINNRTFYHGTATPGLTSKVLDPSKTSESNLYGKGIYTSDEASFRPNLDITPGYATTRADDQLARARENLFGRSNIERAITEGNMPFDALRSVLQSYEMNPRDLAKIGPDIDPRLISSRASSFLGGRPLGDLNRYGWNVPPRPGFSRLIEALGGAPKTEPLIYHGQSDFGKILDLDMPDKKVITQIYDAMTGAGIKPDFLSRSEAPIFHETPGSIYKSMSPDNPDLAFKALRDLGYDAMTHTGGQRTGKDYHQVAIALNPKYQQWQLYKNLTGS